MNFCTIVQLSWEQSLCAEQIPRPDLEFSRARCSYNPVVYFYMSILEQA